MKPALPEGTVVTAAFAAAAMVCAQFLSTDLQAQASHAGDNVRVAIYESPLQKWKRQCRRSGGKYEKYCAGGVKHCCCYSSSYCEGMPEPVDTLRLPTAPGPGDGSGSGAPAGQPLRRAQ